MLIITDCKIKVTPEGIFIPKGGIDGQAEIHSTIVDAEGLGEGQAISDLLIELGVTKVHACHLNIV
jgi:hypothetical protein